MTTSTSRAWWKGDLKGGNGEMTVGPDRWTGPFTFVSRFERGPDADATSPEELLAAAHAGCFSMALSNTLAQAGHTPESVETTAEVSVESGTINRVLLRCDAHVPGIDQATFDDLAGQAKEGCPVSKLFDTEIVLEATLRT